MKRPARQNGAAQSDFLHAVAQCTLLDDSDGKPGLSALLREHSVRISCADGRRWSGSLDLDAALRQVPAHAQAPRWDYGIGYVDARGTERALWVEVHSAETSEVRKVVAKLAWLKDFLNANAQALGNLTGRGDHAAVPAYIWIASGRYNIPRNAPQMRLLYSAGLQPPRQHLALD